MDTFSTRRFLRPHYNHQHQRVPWTRAMTRTTTRRRMTTTTTTTRRRTRTSSCHIYLFQKPHTSISSSLNAPTSHNFLVPTPRIGLSIGWFVSLFVHNEISQESTTAAFYCKIFKKALDRARPRLHEFTRAKGCLDFSKWCICTSVSGETCQNDQSIWRLFFPNPRELRRHWWSGMKLSVQFQPSYHPPFRNFTINSSAGSSFPASIPYTSQIVLPINFLLLLLPHFITSINFPPENLPSLCWVSQQPGKPFLGGGREGATKTTPSRIIFYWTHYTLCNSSLPTPLFPLQCFCAALEQVLAQEVLSESGPSATPKLATR